MDISYYKRYEPIDGKWYITRELGRGAFGSVFEIERHDFAENMKSAMKIISVPSSPGEVESYREENFDLDDKSVTSYFYGFVNDFVNEFQIMHKLRGHSNIVSYEDHTVRERDGEIGWDIFIRMELLTPMNRYFAEHHISEETVIRLGIDICKALEVCQKHQIIHRDIKPSNIFISDTGDFKLGDFGIARTLEKTSSGLSKKGTYTYMAPEVFKGEQYGASVDIYSLGIVMYRLLNNNMEPFRVDRGHGSEENALISRMHGEEMPKPANADGKLAEIILKACSYRAQDRFSSATEMRRELERLLMTIQDSDAYSESYSQMNTDADIYENSNSDDEINDLYDEATEVMTDINEMTEVISQIAANEQNGSNYVYVKETPAKPKNKKILLGVIISVLAVIVVAFAFVTSLRAQLIHLVPESVEMEEGMSIEFLTELYSAGFMDGNINREIIIDTSSLHDVCEVEEYANGVTLIALEPGNATIGVSVNGSKYRQVSVVVYEKIDKTALWQLFEEAENFLTAVEQDETINQDNVTFEKQALIDIIVSYGDMKSKIDDASSPELVEYRTHYETTVSPAVELLKKSYEIAKTVEEEPPEEEKKEKVQKTEGTAKSVKKCSVCGSTSHRVHPKCPTCGSTAHTTHPKCPTCGSSSHTTHPQCPICGSTEHTTHPQCPTCGSTAHTVHPDDLYIEPF